MLNLSRCSVTGASRVILVVGTVYALIGANVLHGQQNVIPEEVIQKWKEFERFSQTIQGTKRLTSTSTRVSQNKPISSSDSYKQNRECALFSRSGTDASGVVPTKWWTLVNPRYAASITTSTSDPDKVLLGDYKLNSVMDLSGTGFSAFDHIFFEVAPHFSYQRTRLSQLVTKDHFTIKKILKTSLDGHELVQLDFSFDDKKQQIHSHGSLYLDTEQCWCIRRIRESYVKEMKGKPFFKFEQTTEYQTVVHPSGFPLVKSQMAQDHGFSGNNKIESTRKIDYEWEINDHVPNSEFTLSAFGLPEPVDVPWEKPTPWYLWFLAATVGCFALALLFRYLYRRQQWRPA